MIRCSAGWSILFFVRGSLLASLFFFFFQVDATSRWLCVPKLYLESYINEKLQRFLKNLHIVHTLPGYYAGLNYRTFLPWSNRYRAIQFIYRGRPLPYRSLLPCYYRDLQYRLSAVNGLHGKPLNIPWFLPRIFLPPYRLVIIIQWIMPWRTNPLEKLRL